MSTKQIYQQTKKKVSIFLRNNNNIHADSIISNVSKTSSQL